MMTHCVGQLAGAQLDEGGQPAPSGRKSRHRLPSGSDNRGSATDNDDDDHHHHNQQNADEETEEECHLLISDGRLQDQRPFRKARRLRRSAPRGSSSSGPLEPPAQPQARPPRAARRHLLARAIAYLSDALPAARRTGGSGAGEHQGRANGSWSPRASFIWSQNPLRLDLNYKNAHEPASAAPGAQSPPAHNRRTLQARPTDGLACRHFLSCLALLFLVLCFASILLKLVHLIDQHDHASREAHVSKLLAGYKQDLDADHRRQLELERAQRWLVSTPKCHIPALEAWHESIKAHVSVKPPMDCKSVIEKFTAEQANLTEPWFKPASLAQTLSFVRGNRLFLAQRALALGPNSCCFRRIERVPDNDEQLEYSDYCEPIREIPLQFGDSLAGKLIQVNCAQLNYTNVHAVVWPAKDEADALASLAYEQLDADNYYNVLLLGMDTISRLNGIRQLNATLAVLDQLYGKLDFLGYNKVGENTFPNLVPLLTGLKPTQLAETKCWLATNYNDNSERADDYLDNCEYLWTFYQQLGYTTYFSEDWPEASTFNYLKPGFRREPTSYYGRPFTLARNALLFPKFHESISCASCQLDQPIVQIDLDNLKSFVASHSNRPYFAFHWINCPQHDDLNGASQVDQIVAQFLRDIHEITQNERTFVVFFSDHGYRWNNFVSTRIGHYESSLPLMTVAPPRRFIERQPQLYEHMKQHQAALLTPFDLFKSLMDIRNLGLKARPTPVDSSSDRPNFHRQKTTVRRRAGPPSAPPAAQPVAATTSAPTAATTVRQVILPNGLTYKQSFSTLSVLEAHNASQLDRSCIEAGIPDNYCVCHQFRRIPAHTSDVLGAAYYLVYVHLNELLRNHRKLCHQLELDTVFRAEFYNLDVMKKSSAATSRRASKNKISAPKRKPTRKTTSTAKPPTSGELDLKVKQNSLPNREYNILFSTKPGTGLFQEVVRYYGDDMDACAAAVEEAKKIVEDKWANLGDKHASVVLMNTVCEFSVHSDSISRLSLYKDESGCVKSNIELKKVCLCKAAAGAA